MYYCIDAVSSKNGNFILTEKKSKTMSRGCPLLLRSLFIRLSLHFPYPTIKIRLLKLLDFEIERNDRLFLKTNEKNYTGDLESD